MFQIGRKAQPDVAVRVEVVWRYAVGTIESAVAVTEFLGKQTRHAVIGKRNNVNVFKRLPISRSSQYAHGAPRPAAGVYDIVFLADLRDPEVDALLTHLADWPFQRAPEERVLVDCEVYAIVGNGDVRGDVGLAPPVLPGVSCDR